MVGWRAELSMQAVGFRYVSNLFSGWFLVSCALAGRTIVIIHLQYITYFAAREVAWRNDWHISNIDELPENTWTSIQPWPLQWQRFAEVH